MDRKWTPERGHLPRRSRFSTNHKKALNGKKVEICRYCEGRGEVLKLGISSHYITKCVECNGTGKGDGCANTGSV